MCNPVFVRSVTGTVVTDITDYIGSAKTFRKEEAEQIIAALNNGDPQPYLHEWGYIKTRAIGGVYIGEEFPMPIDVALLN